MCGECFTSERRVPRLRTASRTSGGIALLRQECSKYLTGGYSCFGSEDGQFTRLVGGNQEGLQDQTLRRRFPFSTVPSDDQRVSGSRSPRQKPTTRSSQGSRHKNRKFDVSCRRNCFVFRKPLQLVCLFRHRKRFCSGSTVIISFPPHCPIELWHLKPAEISD